MRCSRVYSGASRALHPVMSARRSVFATRPSNNWLLVLMPPPQDEPVLCAGRRYGAGINTSTLAGKLRCRTPRHAAIWGDRYFHISTWLRLLSSISFRLLKFNSVYGGPSYQSDALWSEKCVVLGVSHWKELGKTPPPYRTSKTFLNPLGIGETCDVRKHSICEKRINHLYTWNSLIFGRLGFKLTIYSSSHV